MSKYAGKHLDRVHGWLYALKLSWYASPGGPVCRTYGAAQVRVGSSGAGPEAHQGGDLADVEERAHHLGMSVSQILKSDWDELHRVRYPKTPCLLPDELEELVLMGFLQPDRQAQL